MKNRIYWIVKDKNSINYNYKTVINIKLKSETSQFFLRQFIFYKWPNYFETDGVLMT